MNKFIIISDSFKGTISSKEITEIFDIVSKQIFDNVEVVKIPIADGGEGMLDFISSTIKGKFVSLETLDPYFNKINAEIYISDDNTAYIESAKSIGLNLVKELNPSITSSYGVGILIKKAIELGSKKIILGLGGSSTNDGGCGLLSALEVKFTDKNKKEFIPTGKTLKNIDNIDTSVTKQLLNGVEIVGLCDVENTAYGLNGASYIYAPQKGADDLMIKYLDDNIIYFCNKINEIFNIDISNVKGGGAAGAIGAGICGIINAKLLPGIDTLLNEIKFDDMVKDADYVFTGEGRYDYQSSQGKVISGLMKYTDKYNIPLIIICGSIEKEIENNYKNKNNIIFSINRKPEDFEISKYHVKEYYQRTIENILKLIKISKK